MKIILLCFASYYLLYIVRFSIKPIILILKRIFLKFNAEHIVLIYFDPMLGYFEHQLNSISTCNCKGREDERKRKDPSQGEDHDKPKVLCDLTSDRGEDSFYK